MCEDHFGPELVRSYDEDLAEMFDPFLVEPAVEVLFLLADGGRALEFAIGTGRIALPLTARGVNVSGIELSEAMIEQLRRKPGGGDVNVTIGDMAGTRVEGSFRLVYVVFNAIGNLTSQEEQAACFANPAAHLQPGGSFVIEVGVPELRRVPPGERHVVFHADGDSWGIDEYDVAAQGLISHHFHRQGHDLQHRAIPFPLCLAGRARSHGTTRRNDARGALGRLAPPPIRSREHVARFDMAQGVGPRFGRIPTGPGFCLSPLQPSDRDGRFPPEAAVPRSRWPLAPATNDANCDG